MTTKRVPLLVLGLGDLRARDDGLGVAAVSLLARHWRPAEGVRLLAGGTQGDALIPWIESADRLILVDAVRVDEPPGTLVRLDGADEVLYSAADRLPDARLPDSLVLLGIVPERTDTGLHRSFPVEVALPALVDLIVAEAAAMGFPFAPQASLEPALQEMR